jgi:N-acetylglucosaminyl-diphospho-decaprenol L-rhamnosyltransferase
MREKDLVLSIVIITRNAKLLLRKCLQSIYNNIKFPFEAIIVDNGSSDSTVNMIETDFREAIFIRNKRNRGVAPARNQGLYRCRGEYILIIDDDAYILNNAIDAMIDFMRSNPLVGLCGPKMLNGDGTLFPNCKRFPSILTIISNRLFTKPHLYCPDVLYKHLMLDWNQRKPAPVDWIIGACQLIRRETLLEVGFLDDKSFFGGEDVDICFRMWENGWEIWHVPDAVIVHEPRRITKKNPFSMNTLRHTLAMWRIFQKYRQKDFRNISQHNDYKRTTAL